MTSVPVTAFGEVGASASYTITDGTTTISGSKAIPASGKWNLNPNVSSLKDGTLTLTVTETDPAGNPTVQTATIVKKTTPPAAPTVALNPLDDSGSSSERLRHERLGAALHTSPRAAGTTTTVYVNGVVYTGQKLADGSYTVTAVSTDAYGNVVDRNGPAHARDRHDAPVRQLLDLGREDDQRPARGGEPEPDAPALR